MTLPANLRINTSAPFPALVKGSAPIAIGKQNGIWTINLNVLSMGTELPPIVSYPTDFLIVYDSVVGNFFKLPLSSLPAQTRTQRSVNAGPVAFTATDQIINLNLGSSITITLPGYASRVGVPLTFKDATKLAGTTFFPQTIAAAPGEKIDGLASISLSNPGQSITLVPANDGVNAGWMIE